ncbi:C45 family peptidase [Streptomyces sp. MP131-18]|uniref:C45 family autoproteolytic acyltransferase/hydolase n=1 Tax=Streptomyces sp. MP131-18 TaxID=1857892 RepID=UPI00097BE53F|nr:C45 family peptidase [Streptomyces sp. MP131-18]ONK15933.1 putative choloylglycine hydrolase [Streptomyces sp. MP131-18]
MTAATPPSTVTAEHPGHWVEFGLSPTSAAAPAGPRGAFLDLSGTPAEQGAQHGRAARAAIAANIDAVRRDVAELCGDEAARERYERCLAANTDFLRRHDPEQYAELAGIAEGAGVALRDVLALNLPAHMVLRWLPQECSQLVVGGERAAAGTTLLAKTRDMAGHFVDHVVLRRRYPDGRRVVEVTVAGSVLWPGSGVNDAGVAMSTSGVWSVRTDVDWRASGEGWILINSHALLRRAGTAEEFAALLRDQPRLSGLNIALADRTGRRLAVEATAHDVFLRADSDRHVLTNHYECAATAPLAPTAEENGSSYHRGRVAGTALDAARGLTPGELAVLLADHDGHPQHSLCRHQVEGVGSETTYASIAVLPEGAFYVTLGNPCASDRSVFAGDGR